MNFNSKTDCFQPDIEPGTFENFLNKEVSKVSIDAESDSEKSAVPLAIHHIGPFKSLSMFSGTIERDFISTKAKSDRKEEKEPVADESKRGRVIGLSKRSRLRLQVRINRIKFKPGNVFFLTLTYPSEFPPQSVAKTDLRSFFKRVSRKFGKYGCIWRIENQRRGAPHFHLILFLSAFVPPIELSKWVSLNWYEVVGSGCEYHLMYGARTELLRTSKGVSGYCSKYVSKPEEGERVRMIEGRQWGREGEFPEERIDFVFENKQDRDRFMRFCRKSRRVGKHKKQLPGHVGPGVGYQWKSFFCPGLHEDFLRLCVMCGGIQTEFIPENFYEVTYEGNNLPAH